MRTLRTVVAIVLTWMFATACDDSPTRPTDGTKPPPPPIPTLARLELNGQNTIAPGATTEFTLNAVLADGTRTDVTSQAQWSTRGSTYATSLGQGRVRAVAIGETTLDARYTNRSSSREIIVVPDGTFRVIGRIFEDDGVTPVPNAHIRVRDADGTGPQTDADGAGYYRLYGVKREVDFVVTRAGFVDTELKHQTIGEHKTVNIQMPLVGERLQVAGTYTATFNWSNCGAAIPAELHLRVYTAVVKQAGSQIEVRFTEPSFVHNNANLGDLMTGRVDPAGMHVFADSGYYYWYGEAYAPYLTELLPDGHRLVSWGEAYLMQAGNRFSGTLQGEAWLYRRVGQTQTFLGSCRVANVSFERR